ncbi:non-ribosomal peptide synthetase [Jidongwangia harbinensis]|uniref:non-ribosomal peptide synthetase n=1 Tax=Jidongwangia harbinensis TaxID=2878561 RepID=UPI001CD94814|nr:non-ribosomal peptide synthetase [Jidongwangia harbinensis]MCA2218374.1 amino acid adenylation domain-containing protein [Jidongwangia harbinensis]
MTKTTEIVLPAQVGTAARRLAGELPVAPAALLLAAHATVTAALGDNVPADGVENTPAPRPDTGAGDEVHCDLGMLVAEPGSWSDLIRRAHDVLPGTLFEDDIQVVGATGGSDFRANLGWRAGTLTIRLDWCGDAPVTPDPLSGGVLERLAGYYRSALEQMTADPDAAHHSAVVLSHDEERLLLDGLAGPVRDLPDRRFHEIFAAQARRTPAAVAAVHREVSWTYAELDRYADKVAWALVEHQAGPGDVVAVVADRDLDWLAAVVGILRAGTCYLPVAPDLPAERIAAMLARTGCRTVLTGSADRSTLDDALALLPDVRSVPLDTVLRGPERPAGGPRVAVQGTDLAYIYFTSGSTGEPKGAMCEHDGMLNHLLAKIEDLGLDAGRTVAQTAPQSFDISLWQLIAPLLVGGRTLLVAQDDITDVGSFVALLAAQRVDVVQLVPSYLAAVLTFVADRHVDLPDLRLVSATGEALPASLAARWFARFPHVPLVNAYGLTETSDDTNHEVLREPPAGDAVPLGRPIRNVSVRVVDEHRRLVAFGAPGEIMFSGVCVGRGYINDPERTARAFIGDPFRPGERAYLSGDYGRWLPDGRLAFLGRRDAQVKVHGFRIEIGEIENRLRGLPGVDAAAVVAVPAGTGDTALAAFWTGAVTVSEEAVRAGLARSLPSYMVPRSISRLPTLPLTGNGKVDRAALRALAGTDPLGRTDGDAPRTATERAVAVVWAELLAIPLEHIRREDDFFALGATSLSAIRLAMRLDGELTPAQIVEHSVLADLAATLAAR